MCIGIILILEPKTNVDFDLNLFILSYKSWDFLISKRIMFIGVEKKCKIQEADEIVDDRLSLLRSSAQNRKISVYFVIKYVICI